MDTGNKESFVPEVLQVEHLFLSLDSLNIPLFSEPKISQSWPESPPLHGPSILALPPLRFSSLALADFRDINGRKQSGFEMEGSH